MAEELDLGLRLAVALGIGLLMGLERERSPGRRAGLRSFALIALFGWCAGLLTQASGSGWVLAAGVAIVGATLLLAPRKPDEDDPDPGTTTIFAGVLCFALGAVVWFGQTQVAVVAAIAATTLMYFKAELHGLSRSLSRQDYVSFLQFALISLVVLPVLPDRGYGPYEALNPYKIWLMVVLICGLSLAGYVVLRLVGTDRGIPLLGILGGLASSTATTLVYARHARSRAELVPVAESVILTANLVVLVRLAVLAAMVQPSVLPRLVPVLALGLVAGLVFALLAWRRLARDAEAPQLELENPVELKPALTFGALFGAVLLATAWLNDVAGAAGVYALAFVAGLTDVDAIFLSSLSQGTLDAAQVVRVAVVAYVANLAFKAAMVAGTAGRALLWPVLRGFAAVAAGLIAGAALMS